MTAESIQMFEERLEAISGECARAFRTVAPQLIAHLEVNAFERWATQGVTLAQGGWRAWEPAAWYFRLSPQFLARLDLDGLAGLLEPVGRLTAHMPQLGIELLRGAARFLEHDRPVTLGEWVSAGERLLPIGRGGRLASAYFEVSPEVLALTSLTEYQEWLALVHTLAGTAEASALELLHQSPLYLERVPPLARLKALRLVHTLARQAPSLATDVLKTLPTTLHAVHSSLHDRLLDLAQRTAEMSPHPLDRLLKAMARLLQGLPQAQQDLLLGECLRVTLVDAEAGVHLCEHLPDVLRQLTIDDLGTWVGHGLTALRANREAGLAFFALESQACQSQLAMLARLVYLHDQQGVLRLYASALAGQPLGVRPLAELPPAFRSQSRHFPTTDGETIYLPPRADRFQTRGENFWTYLVMTAHQAGALEFGTFTFSLDTLTQRLGLDTAAVHPPPAASSSADKSRYSDLKPLPPGEGEGGDGGAGSADLTPTRTLPPQGGGDQIPGLVGSTWRREDMGGQGEEATGHPLRSDFGRFFAGFPRPSVARDIFYGLEEGRIDYLLGQAYRGLAPHLAHVIRDGLASRPPLTGRSLWEAVLEVLLSLCSTGMPPPRLPRLLTPLTPFLRRVADDIRRPQATVYDSAAGTMEIYRLLAQLPNVRLAALGDLSEEGELVGLADALSPEAALQAFQQMAPSLSPAEEVAYQSPDPLPHRGDLKPELVQRKLKIRELSDTLEQMGKAAMPIPPELLKALLEQGVDIDIRGLSTQARDETSGLFVSDLEGKTLSETLPSNQKEGVVEPEQIRSKLQEELKTLGGGEAVFLYDEWDYLMRDYRVRWCLLREQRVEGEGEGFVAGVLQEHAALISQVRRQFQLLKPELFKKLKRRDHGEDIDIDAAVEGVVDRRVTGIAPELVYIKRDKREREVSTVFLLDLSASTDDPIEPTRPLTPPVAAHRPLRAPHPGSSGRLEDDTFYAPLFVPDQKKPPSKRIIDVEKEALIVMAEALESIGDEYAIYGFSGYGRENVEFPLIKEFEERYSEAVRRRIDVLKPRRSTRMGPAIRHAIQKLQRRPARLKTLILLSDGYPQDFDYGKDRRGKEYGIQDTKVALQEAWRKRVHTFCITVDREGKAYLPEMCGEDRFIVIEKVARLPQLLPKIYRGLTT